MDDQYFGKVDAMVNGTNKSRNGIIMLGFGSLQLVLSWILYNFFLFPFLSSY